MKNDEKNAKRVGGGENSSPDSQRRRRDIFVATRTNQNSSSVRSDIAWRCRPLMGLNDFMICFLQRYRTYGAAKPGAALDAESAEVLGNIKALI